MSAARSAGRWPCAAAPAGPGDLKLGAAADPNGQHRAPRADEPEPEPEQAESEPDPDPEQRRWVASLPGLQSTRARALRWGCWGGEDRAWLAAAESHFGQAARLRPLEPAHAVPRRLHHVWFGGALPAEFRAWTDSWAKLHPDWDLRCGCVCGSGLDACWGWCCCC